MKKVTIIIGVLLSVLVYSCSKTTTSTTANGGSWTFKGLTYQSTFSNYTRGSFVSTTGTNIPTGSLLFNFKNYADSLNPVPGTYTITNAMTPADSLHVYIVLSDSSSTRYYKPTASASTLITITRTGKLLSITVPPTEMVSNLNPSDSALLSATITQTP